MLSDFRGFADLNWSLRKILWMARILPPQHERLKYFANIVTHLSDDPENLTNFPVFLNLNKWNHSEAFKEKVSNNFLSRAKRFSSPSFLNFGIFFLTSSRKTGKFATILSIKVNKSIASKGNKFWVLTKTYKKLSRKFLLQKIPCRLKFSIDLWEWLRWKAS